MDRKESRKFSVFQMCAVLVVSESGYYRWLKSRYKEKPWQTLLVKIYEIREEHPDNDNYGVNRMHLALRNKGENVSWSTVRRAMKRGSLLHRGGYRPDGLTRAQKNALKPTNLLKRDFTAERPNQKWLSDITQIPCSDGKLYIAPVMDCYGGEIVSLAMDGNMKKELCIKATEDAYIARGKPAGVINHSDGGSQYTSIKYKETITQYHGIQSMSDVGKCYDNARMESFFATLKKEKLYRIDTMKMTMEEVKTVVFRYVMIYYNRVRISTVNDGLTPEQYRLKYKTEKTAA
jgi:transposase InsO family protein